MAHTAIVHINKYGCYCLYGHNGIVLSGAWNEKDIPSVAELEKTARRYGYGLVSVHIKKSSEVQR